MTRVRLAPAPTGFLHSGGAGTCKFNRLFAGAAGGRLVARTGDTAIEGSGGAWPQSILAGWTGIEKSRGNSAWWNACGESEC